MDYRSSKYYEAAMKKKQGMTAAQIAEEMGLSCPQRAHDYAWRGRDEATFKRFHETNTKWARRRGVRSHAEFCADRLSKSWWSKRGRTEELKRLWMTSLYTADIAARLGTTRNAVIGKANRLGLPWKKS